VAGCENHHAQWVGGVCQPTHVVGAEVEEQVAGESEPALAISAVGRAVKQATFAVGRTMRRDVT